MKKLAIARVTRAADGFVVAGKAFQATSVFARMKGLLGENGLAPGEGLLLAPCNSVHTWFMRFPIDVVYLAGDLEILKIRRDMRPWRADWPVKGARSVLELASGGAAELREGDYLCIN